MPYERELDVAGRTVLEAAEVALKYFAQGVPVEEKPNRTPVTIADRECEAIIRRLLVENFPEDAILGEEGTSKASSSGRRWLIDPIDGTRDFVRGTSFWSVQLALEVNGQVVLGIIHLPCMKETLEATLGGGCYWNGSRIHASALSRLDKAIVTLSGFPAIWQSWPAEAIRYLTESCWTVRGYSACYDVAMVARGKVDIWLSGGGWEWDYAPGRIIARECGAKFLNRDGGDRIDARHCLICAPGLEAGLRQILGIRSPSPLQRALEK